MNREMILHTDAAKSCEAKVRGMLHDKGAPRQSERQAPAYVRFVQHNCPKTGRTVVVKSGSQIVDRASNFLKERVQIHQHSVSPV